MEKCFLFLFIMKKQDDKALQGSREQVMETNPCWLIRLKPLKGEPIRLSSVTQKGDTKL